MSGATHETWFTAAQISRALGCSRQNIHQQLAAVAADGEQLVSGNLAKAWRIESLPPQIMRLLASKAELKGYATIAAFLLGEPFKRYESKIPFGEIAPSARQKALKLQQALRPFVRTRDLDNSKTAEFAQRGLDEYRRVFGYLVSAKHWRELFDRTIERDNGNEEFERPEIYLCENPPRISSTRPIAIARERGLELLESAFTGLSEAATLTVENRVYLWTKACDELQLQIESGAHEKKTKRAILKTLLASGLLGTNKETLRRNLTRRWTAYRSNHRRLTDRRATREQRKRLPEDDRNILRARTIDCGGRLSQAYREALDNADLISLRDKIANPKSKSYVPATVRRDVGNRRQIKPLLTLHRSERDFELSSAHNTRDYSGLFPGDSYQGDDCTCPVYYWDTDCSNPNGYRIIRGQLILMIDERTLLALGFALHSERNYNARVIRTLITRVHDDWGLPRRRFYFERGIWRDSKILTGGRNSGLEPVPIAETEMGLREFGIEFRFAKYPRGKVVERVLGIVQNEMERLPGYVGRDERHDRYEKVQRKINRANNGQIHPSDFLMDRDQWKASLATLIDKCNSERRGGRILNGLSSLDAWNKFQPLEAQVRLSGEGRIILADCRVKMKVQDNGITLRKSLGAGNYCGEVTGKLRGRDMLIWVNPEDLSAIGITSLDRKEGPFAVPRLDPLPAIDPSREQFEISASQIRAHNDQTRTVYRSLSPHLAIHNFRTLHRVDARTTEIGASLRTQKAILAQERQKNARAINRAQRLVRERGINVRVDTKNAERATAAAQLVREAYSDSITTGAR
jgi:hypothetical protein